MIMSTLGPLVLALKNRIFVTRKEPFSLCFVNGGAMNNVVLEEKEMLLKEKEARQKRLDYLADELENLRKQQGYLLRKKRREKDGHKDPLLVENGKLQEDIMHQMSLVRQQIEETVKKLSELEKVAKILGVVIQDKNVKSSDKRKDNILEKVLRIEDKGSSSKAISTRKDSPEKLDAETNKLCTNLPESGGGCEYHDAWNHWCKNCNTICGTLFDFFTHMHNKRHRQTLDPYDRPWTAKIPSEDKNASVKRTDKITMPARGSEFLMPVTGFYCQLCDGFYGDQICAEDHVKSHGHNEKYKEYLNENPVYEQRRNLDRQAGLVVITETERRRQASMKRKMDDEKEFQKQKRLEESDERKAKLMRLDMEERESVTELEEERSDRSSSHKIEFSNKPGIKLMLKKDEIEDKKDEEQGSSFGKFSWKKPEKEEEKSSTVGVKEENSDGSKEKDDGKGQGGKAAPKTIEIKLSGKTLIAHTSPWVPFTSVSTTTQAKIRPNLPVANMPLRKASGSSVSKPAPLDTFLSIRSSGASNKPLPVVKAGVLLPPDVISRAFGGEEVTLKGSILDVHREPDRLAEEPAPGVSTCEQTILAVPVRPPPSPLASLADSSKKTEKPKSCLAAANAKDLYGIYYSSSGKSPADRLGSNAQSAKLVPGTLKPAAGQIKNGDGKPSEELVHSENTIMATPKPAVPGQSNESDEQSNMGPCEIEDLSISPKLQNTSDVMTAQQEMINIAEQPAGGDGNLGFTNPSEKVGDEEMNASALQAIVGQPQQGDGVTISLDEAKDVEELHTSKLDSAGQSQHDDIFHTVKQVQYMEIGVVVSDNHSECQQYDLSNSSAPQVKDVELAAPVFVDEGDRNASILTAREVGDADTPTLDSAVDDGLNISNQADQVRDEVHTLDSTAEHCLEPCDNVLIFPTAVKKVEDMEKESPVLDNTVDQPAHCDTDFTISEPVDEVKGVGVSVDQLEQCDTDLKASELVDEVKEIKVDAFISNNTAKQKYEVGFSINPMDEVGNVEVNTPILDDIMQQQQFGAVKQVKVEKIDGHKVDQIGSNEIRSSLQTDLCDSHAVSGSIPDKQDIELTRTLQVKSCGSEGGTHFIKELGTGASSSLQAEQVGTDEQTIPNHAEQCREMGSSQQPDNSESSSPDTKQDRHHGGSSFPEAEDLSEYDRVNISDQTRLSSDSQISTLNSEVQAADSVEKAPDQPPVLQNVEVSTSEMAQKESKPSGSQSTEAGGKGKTGIREECKSSSRTTSRRAAQTGKGALGSDKTTEKRASDESANIQAPATQPRRRSARNLRSAK
ncbi:hypothetical protein scyTo_0010071 [Scyliorhinus torazame]|uniref:C2H2-type domain-containing protein n=1 Tax=Scyliorhinus torazame TaxID=75743 RepID=A0A401NZC9_SCYTO|nr:hypothetical protein [Scyliorhinus torazame]